MKSTPTAKQNRFIDEYLVDLNATAAAIRAGYSSKTARQIASETLAKPYIQEAVAKAKLERSKATKIDSSWVLTQAVKLHRRCMSEIRPAKNPKTRKLIKDEQGNQLFTFNAAGASRALELVGTVLDDLCYHPMNEVPERIKKLRTSTRDFLKRHFAKDVRAFGAFEIDVKRADLVDDDSSVVDLLRQYGLQDEPEPAYMPHLHAIVSLNDISAREFGNKLRSHFSKTKQVTVKPLLSGKTKNDNLKTLARYPFKFRYQFANNILRDKPSYGRRFDDDILRVFTQLVHSIKGKRGAIGFEFRYNL